MSKVVESWVGEGEGGAHYTSDLESLTGTLQLYFPPEHWFLKFIKSVCVFKHFSRYPLNELIFNFGLNVDSSYYKRNKGTWVLELSDNNI